MRDAGQGASRVEARLHGAKSEANGVSVRAKVKWGGSNAPQSS